MKIFQKLQKRKTFWLVLILILSILFLLFFAKYIMPYSPYEVDMSSRLEKESALHLFGTDQLGRDLFSRILAGGEVTIFLALTIVFFSSFIGIFIGGICGVLTGIFDKILTAVLDVILAFPGTIVALGLLGLLGPGITNIAIALILTKWAEYARVTRAIVISECAKPYVTKAMFSGASRWRVIYHLVFPNTIVHLIVMMCQDIGSIILTVAGFSVIGIGVQPPYPEWGALLLGSQAFLMTAPWLLIYPGLAILIVVSIFNYLGDLLRDALDPYDHSELGTNYKGD